MEERAAVNGVVGGSIPSAGASKARRDGSERASKTRGQSSILCWPVGEYCEDYIYQTQMGLPRGGLNVFAILVALISAS